MDKGYIKTVRACIQDTAEQDGKKIQDGWGGTEEIVARCRLKESRCLSL